LQYEYHLFKCPVQMKQKIPILLVTYDRPHLLDKVIKRLLIYTNWDEFELWICSNSSTPSNKRIISAFTEKYKDIKVFEQDINQVALILNSVITELKRDIYIKLDDDILVSEDWYKGFLGVYNRHSNDISIGSLLIPVNGFGWTLFLEIMGLTKEFRLKFPDVKLIQGCTEPASWNDINVNEFIWSKCLDIDKTAKNFREKQSGFTDYDVPYRYSIGGIIFSHSFWEKMNGWKVSNKFNRRLRLYSILNQFNDLSTRIRKKEKQRRIQQVIKIITNMHESELGVEEEHLFRFSKDNGYKQYVTTENIIFHFAFFPAEDYLMKKVFLDIKF